MKYFILLSTILISISVNAAEVVEAPRTPAAFPCPKELGTDLTFPKGKAFEIMEYIPQTETYRVLSVRLPDESEMFVTLEALVLAVPKIRANRDVIVRNPQEIVGQKYLGQKDLKVLTDKEVEARRGCHR